MGDLGEATQCVRVYVKVTCIHYGLLYLGIVINKRLLYVSILKATIAIAATVATCATVAIATAAIVTVAVVTVVDVRCPTRT